MTSDTCQHKQRTLAPSDRTEEQKALIRENNLDELPDELTHPNMFGSGFRGVPGETVVYKMKVFPLMGEDGKMRLPSDWLLEIQDRGWEVAEVETSKWYSENQELLRRLLQLDSLPVVGEVGLTVFVQHPDSDYLRSPKLERNMIDERESTLQRS